MTSQPRLERIWERLERAEGRAALQSAAESLRDHYAVLHIAYHWVAMSGLQYGCGTYGPTWSARYQARDYLRIDPVVIGCYRRFRPVDWKDLDWTPRAARAFRRDAPAPGLGAPGVRVPRSPLSRRIPWISCSGANATWVSTQPLRAVTPA